MEAVRAASLLGNILNTLWRRQRSLAQVTFAVMDAPLVQTAVEVSYQDLEDFGSEIYAI